MVEVKGGNYRMRKIRRTSSKWLKWERAKIFAIVGEVGFDGGWEGCLMGEFGKVFGKGGWIDGLDSGGVLLFWFTCSLANLSAWEARGEAHRTTGAGQRYIGEVPGHFRKANMQWGGPGGYPQHALGKVHLSPRTYLILAPTLFGQPVSWSRRRFHRVLQVQVRTPSLCFPAPGTSASDLWLPEMR